MSDLKEIGQIQIPHKCEICDKEFKNKNAQWSYRFVKHAFKVKKLLFIQATSTFTTHKALFGEHGTSVQT